MVIAVALAASLLYRRCTTVPSGPSASAPADSAVTAPVIRDTVYVEVGGETVPVVRERPAEKPREVPGETSAPAPAPAPPAETVVSIPVSDLTGLIRQKSGRDITVSTKAPDHIDISYSDGERA